MTRFPWRYVQGAGTCQIEGPKGESVADGVAPDDAGAMLAIGDLMQSCRELLEYAECGAIRLGDVGPGRMIERARAALAKAKTPATPA